jgi:hypothetical protein
MADLPPYPGTPRWVKVFGIVAVVPLLLFVILLHTGVIGGHGPASSMTESHAPGGHTPHGGGH